MKKLMIYLIALIMLSPVTAFGGNERREKRKVEKALRDTTMGEGQQRRVKKALRDIEKGDKRRQERKVKKALRDNEIDYKRRKQQEEWDRLKQKTDRDRKRKMNPKNDLEPRN